MTPGERSPEVVRDPRPRPGHSVACGSAHPCTEAASTAPEVLRPLGGRNETARMETAVKKPRLVVYREDGITSWDIYGEKILELSGPYTDDMKALLAGAKYEKTEEIDRT